MTDLILLKKGLRDAVRPRRLLETLLLILLPAAIGLLWRSVAPPGRFDPELAYNTLAATLIFGFILTILSVNYGTGVLTQELEQKTIVYLLTRPLPRWRLLLVKYVGSVIAISITVVLSALLLSVVVHGPAKIGGSRVFRDIAILPVGALAYGGLFLLLATFLKRPLTYGLLFAFGWESWVPNMPGTFPKFSIMTYLRTLAPHPLPGNPGDFLASFLPKVTIPTGQAWATITAIILASLLAALVIFSQREYAPRDDAE